MQEDHKSVWHYVDVLIRFMAGLALVPLAIIVLFLAIFATDAPGSGLVLSLLVVGLGTGLVFLIYKSCRASDSIAEKLEMFGKYNKMVLRIPAYLYAPVGLYFGSKFIAGIAVNLHLPKLTLDILSPNVFLQVIESPTVIVSFLLLLVIILVKRLFN
jgi:ABC-type nickel/cobalt efflux system permease component RcnA